MYELYINLRGAQMRGGIINSSAVMVKVVARKWSASARAGWPLSARVG